MKMSTVAISLAALAAPLAATSAVAQEASPLSSDIVLTNAAARDGIVLTGPDEENRWGYSIDPYGDGLYGFHGSAAGMGHQRFDPRNVDQYTRENPTALFEYDMRQAPKVSLPASWDAHAPEMRHYEGLVWYERGFEAEIADDERAFLRFGAVNYHARVYLNGEMVCEHEGGFTPFACEVTDILREGENRVAVGVDSIRDETSVPPPVTDWETYGGITRPVKLVVTPETFIDDAWVRLSADGDAILADVRLDGPDASGQTVRVEIDGVNADLSGEAGENGTWQGRAAIPADLDLWSPQDPTLYDVTITAASDTVAERIGFRTVAVEGEQVLLNGEPIFLRGISMHEEELGENPARTITEDAAREQLTIIKDELNGNFVRLAHYPHAEITTRLADEIGLLVWSEIPVYWRIDWDNEETLATARQMLADNILRDRNRAAIALWSIGNETPVSDARNVFLNQLADDVRALDDTRLVTAALLTEAEEIDGVLTSTVDDPLVDALDVMAVNTYHGWYGPVPLEDVSETRWRSDHGKPLIFSELGAGAQPGFSDPDIMRKFSEDYQAEYYRETLEMADEVDFLAGLSPWILKDFRSPRRQHPVYQEGWNRKGLISQTGDKKPAFSVLSDYYADKEADD